MDELSAVSSIQNTRLQSVADEADGSQTSDGHDDVMAVTIRATTTTMMMMMMMMTMITTMTRMIGMVICMAMTPA